MGKARHYPLQTENEMVKTPEHGAAGDSDTVLQGTTPASKKRKVANGSLCKVRKPSRVCYANNKSSCARRAVCSAGKVQRAAYEAVAMLPTAMARHRHLARSKRTATSRCSPAVAWRPHQRPTASTVQWRPLPLPKKAHLWIRTRL